MGVKRAVDMVLEIASNKGQETIYTYGPLIHNPQTIELLRQRGVEPVGGPEELERIPPGSLIVIRAHGIPPQEKRNIEEKGFKIVDATCPRVTRVQLIIRKYASAGFKVLIVGDPGHPEVNGLLGFAGENGIIIGSSEEIQRLEDYKKVCLVAQTTQSMGTYNFLAGKVKEKFPDAVIFDTICDTTEERQAEVETLADESDAVFVVGGKNSANTKRLVEIARTKGKPTFHIETADELAGLDMESYSRIGVSAGASTPNWIIDRVVDHLNIKSGKQKKFLYRLFKIWVFAVRNDLYSAIGAGCLTFTAMLMQEITLSLKPVLVASFYVYGMHVLNRFINRKKSNISSFREESYLTHEKLYLTLAGFSIVGALGISSTIGFLPFLVLFSISLLGAIYNMRLLPSGSRFRSLRDIPGSKNGSTAFAWAVAAVFLPRLGGPPVYDCALIAAFFFVAGIVFVRSAMSDMLEIQRDRLIGQETLPVFIGEKKTLVMLKVIGGGLMLLLFVSPLMGCSTSVAYIQFLSVFYLWICFWLYDRRSAISGVVLEGFLESSYIVAGAGSLIWLEVIGVFAR